MVSLPSIQFTTFDSVEWYPFESNIDASFDFASADQEQFASLLCIGPDDIRRDYGVEGRCGSSYLGSRGANGVIDITTKRV